MFTTKSFQQSNQNIITFLGKATNKSEIIDKLKDEVAYCREKRQDTLWFFYHYATDQMQMIDTNKDFRTMRELYKLQGHKFAGNFETVGITPEMVGPNCKSLSYNLYKGTKSNPVDPLSTLMGYMPAETELVIFEMKVNIYGK